MFSISFKLSSKSSQVGFTLAPIEVPDFKADWRLQTFFVHEVVRSI